MANSVTWLHTNMLGAHIPCPTRWLFGPDEVFFFTEIFLLTKMFVLGWYYQSKPIRLTFDNHFCKWNYWTPSLAVRQPCCRMITYVQSSFTKERSVNFLSHDLLAKVKSVFWNNAKLSSLGLVSFIFFLVRSVWRIPRPPSAPQKRPIYQKRSLVN